MPQENYTLVTPVGRRHHHIDSIHNSFSRIHLAIRVYRLSVACNFLRMAFVRTPYVSRADGQQVQYEPHLLKPQTTARLGRSRNSASSGTARGLLARYLSPCIHASIHPSIPFPYPDFFSIPAPFLPSHGSSPPHRPFPKYI